MSPFVWESKMIYDFIFAILSASILIMLLIGVVFYEEDVDYWVVIGWQTCFLFGMMIGKFLFGGDI